MQWCLSSNFYYLLYIRAYNFNQYDERCDLVSRGAKVRGLRKIKWIRRKRIIGSKRPRNNKRLCSTFPHAKPLKESPKRTENLRRGEHFRQSWDSDPSTHHFACQEKGSASRPKYFFSSTVLIESERLSLSSEQRIWIVSRPGRGSDWGSATVRTKKRLRLLW